MRIRILSAAIVVAIAASAAAQIRPVDPRLLKPQPTPIARLKVTPTPVAPLITYPLTVTYRNNGTLVYRVFASGATLSCPGATSRPPVTVTCTANVAPGTTVTLNAEWSSGNGTGGAQRAARSEPVKADAWGGDCRGTPTPACRLMMTAGKSVTVGL